MPARAIATPAPVQPDVPVAAYLVKETGSQNVIMAKDIDYQVSPASLTKILTCVMAIESGRMDDIVVIPREATLVEPTKAGLRPGDRVFLRDLVRAAMVNSSNDAAFSIGIYLGGSVESFVASMNARARSLGMNSSYFTNPAGFDTGIYAGNRTTARDLMTLTEYAVRHQEFNTIARLDRAVFRELSTGRVFSLRTHNRMLDLYPYSVGIKTGFTNRAGKCLVARAIRDRKDLLMVMLNARTDRWALASNMFDRGFGLNGTERIAMPAPLSRDSGVIHEPSSRQVALERERALEAIRRKLARQGDTDMSAAAIRPRSSSSRGRSLAMSSIQGGGDEVKATMKGMKRTTLDRKMSLKSSKVARKSKQLKAARLAMKKSPAKRNLATSALKKKKSARSVKRTVVSQKKKSGEMTKTNRQKSRRDEVSLLMPVSELTVRS